MGSLDDIHLVSDSEQRDGSHRVTYRYVASGTAGSSTFTVERNGTNVGLFSAWRFSTSPTAVLEVTPLHAGSVTINDFGISPSAGADLPTGYAVLTPSAFALAHHSTWLMAPPRTALVSAPGRPVSASVDVEPKTAFVTEATKEIHAFLSKCVTQHVLLPTGCPMGQQITDRIEDAPTWSMVTYPSVRIVPGKQPGSWQVPATTGTAHLVVKVTSIFDGSTYTFDHDVPFTVSWVITFQGDGSLLITGQY
jgi:hypothetical protein